MKLGKCCTKCGIFKPLEDFNKHKQTKDGLSPSCKKCKQDYAILYRARIRDFKKDFRTSIKIAFGEIVGKCCSQCNEFKIFEFFSKNKNSSDGHKSACKLCLQADSILYRRNNKDKAKAYWESIKDVISIKRKQDRKDNPDKYKIIDRKRTIQRSKCHKTKAYRANYYQENKERIDATKKVYYENNKERLKKIKLETNRKRYHSDILYRLKIINRARIGAFFRTNKFKKESSSMDLLGCDIVTYKNHLESLFTDGMSWENYGEWEIDHKIPLASANDVDELNGLCHYLNTQPLWKEENKSKGNRILN